jgi:hypothetical protein
MSSTDAVPPRYPADQYPRRLPEWQSRAITEQAITRRYPED